MHRWFLFFLLSLCICGYIYQWSTWPKQDLVLQSYLASRASADKEKINLWHVEVLREPEVDSFHINLIVNILSHCHTPESCVDLSNLKTQKTKMRIPISFADEVGIGSRLFVEGTVQLVSHGQNAYEERAYINNRKNKIFSELKSVKVLSVANANQFNIKKSLIQIRQSIEEKIAFAIPAPEHGLAQGLVISGKDSLSKEILEDFKRVGLIHIVVLSGSNVSIISQALFNVLSFAPVWLQSILSIFLMSCFALMTGASPPVVRSVLMSSLPLVLTPLFKLHSTLKILFLVAGIMALFNPLLPLYDMSFQLSFLATFGLIVLSKPISNKLSFIPKKFGMRDIVSTSLATQIYITPLLLHMSGSLSIVFLIANIVVLPLLPITMFFIFLIPLSSFILPISTTVIGAVSYYLLKFIMSFAQELSTFPLAIVEIIQFDGLTTVLIYIFMFILTALLLPYTQACE